MKHQLFPTDNQPALVSRVRDVLFEDPAWDERFDALIRLTKRSSLLAKLTNQDLSLKKIRERLKDRLGDDGVKTLRGAAKTLQSDMFLGTRQERDEAAFLLALHYGSSARNANGRLDQSRVMADHVNQARFVDKLIAVYNKFRKEFYPDGGEARMSFEDYVLLIEGVQLGSVVVNSCKDCGSLWPWRLTSNALHMTVVCPTCTTLNIDMQFANSVIAKRHNSGQGSYKRYG